MSQPRHVKGRYLDFGNPHSEGRQYGRYPAYNMRSESPSVGPFMSWRMSDGGQSNVYNLVRKKKKKLIQVPEPFEDGRLSPSVTLRNASRLSRYEMMDYEGRDDDADSTHMTPRD